MRALACDFGAAADELDMMLTRREWIDEKRRNRAAGAQAGAPAAALVGGTSPGEGVLSELLRATPGHAASGEDEDAELQQALVAARQTDWLCAARTGPHICRASLLSRSGSGARSRAGSLLARRGCGRACGSATQPSAGVAFLGGVAHLCQERPCSTNGMDTCVITLRVPCCSMSSKRSNLATLILKP